MKRLKAAFRTELGIGSRTAADLLAGARLYDKAYELSCLIETMQHLKSCGSSVSFTLIGGCKPKFRGKGGDIQRGVWPFIEMYDGSTVVAEIWVDIECLALSAWVDGKAAGNPPFGRAHELDVIVVEPGASGKPEPGALKVGIEAKHRPFNKALLKELLGVRRETAFKSDDGPNPFAWWQPGRELPAEPPSGIVLFCSDVGALNYVDPAEFWGLEMIHHVF
ncbi:hypothetical protein CA833_21555 [Novosphingobium sp. KA1]|nr:hypothetical protein CA833_21555 [Novosphingobium sp. KA1]